MEWHIRNIEPKEFSILEDFTYEAIYTPVDSPSYPKSIIQIPEIKVYYDNFGNKEGDQGLVVEHNDKIIGAAWVRILDQEPKGYGFVNNQTPELAISLLSQYRGLGIGSSLMNELFILLKNNGYEQLSLSVNKENPATKMYAKLGFNIIKENKEDYLMLKLIIGSPLLLQT